MLGVIDFIRAELAILADIGMGQMSEATRATVKSAETCITETLGGPADSRWPEGSASEIRLSATHLVNLFEYTTLIQSVMRNQTLSVIRVRDPSDSPYDERGSIESRWGDTFAAWDRSEQEEAIHTLKAGQLFIMFHEVCHLIRGHHALHFDALPADVVSRLAALSCGREWSARDVLCRFLELDADNQAATFVVQRISAGPISVDQDGKPLLRLLAEAMRSAYLGMSALFVVEDNRLSLGGEALLEMEHLHGSVVVHPFVRWLNAVAFSRLAQRKWLVRFPDDVSGGDTEFMEATRPDMTVISSMPIALGLPADRWTFTDVRRRDIAEEAQWNLKFYYEVRPILEPWLRSLSEPESNK